MLNINFDEKTICLISIMTFILAMYYIKRKFDTISEYIKLVAEKLETYKENQKQYKKVLDDLDLSTKDQNNFISKIIEILKDIKGSG